MYWSRKMNGKLFGAVCLVAGTAIGSGMIALPIVLAKLGILASILVMILMGLVGYYTALVGLELNLRAKKGLTLGKLGFHFSGPRAHTVGSFCLLFLCYALLAAYINGAGSMLAKVSSQFGFTLTQETWTNLVTAGLFVVLFYGISFADYTNRILFTILMIGIVTLVIWLAPGIGSSLHYPGIDQVGTLTSWTVAIPVLFTSFGFQVIFHTMADYLEMHKGNLKKAFLWGTVIPAISYIAWAVAVLLFISHHNPAFYANMVLHKIEVGDLVGELSHLVTHKNLQLVVWGTALFAILTSIIGVGLALKGQIEEQVHSMKSQVTVGRKFIISAIAILPPYGVAVMIPGAFIKALAFAGMILAVIAIILPLYLLHLSDKRKEYDQAHYPLLENHVLRGSMMVLGVLIILAELYNMFL